ncbi:MAG: serine protein kinase RIO [Pseudonocardia sp.]
MREHDRFTEPIRRRRRRIDEDEAPARSRTAPPVWDTTDTAAPPEGDRWSTWDGARHGPVPRPAWVVTDHAAVDTERGVLKTGKEADVHLVERAVPGTDRRCLLAAKRYRTAEHRMFHRDAGYLEGRRVRRSREMRAMARRTGFGLDLLSGQWADAEFGALAALWSDGVAVPYPVQVGGTELMLEFVGTPDGAAAPRLAQVRPEPRELVALWDQLVAALHGLARRGWTHGDLSAYNLLVDGDRLVLIDLPQVVEVVANPRGPDYLHRDVARIGEWFVARGLPGRAPDVLLADLLVALGMV